jgi:hypothetical protein
MPTSDHFLKAWLASFVKTGRQTVFPTPGRIPGPGRSILRFVGRATGKNQNGCDGEQEEEKVT